MRFELKGMGCLMEGDPRAEVVERHAQRLSRRPDVFLNEEKLPRSRFGREQCNVVLAEHPRGQVGQDERDLLRGHGAVRERGDPLAQVAVARDEPIAQGGLDVPVELPEDDEVRTRPFSPAHCGVPIDDAG